MLTKFQRPETAAYKTYYDAHGYVIIEGLIPEELIAAFLCAYDRFRQRRYYLFQAQDTNRPEFVRLTPEGFMTHSMLDPKDLLFAGEFAASTRACVAHPLVAEALQALSGVREHIIWQTMFFDKSTGTVAHQDHYYLDSDPPGKNIALWISLEDIQEDAGVFYVVPGSHTLELVPATLDHEAMVAAVQEMIRARGLKPLPCPLKRGDVLFWHPSLIHGAYQNANPNHSRKSFTAHYLPVGYRMSGHTHGVGRLHENVPLGATTFREWKRSYPRKLLTFGLRYLRYAFFAARPNRGIRYDLRSGSYKDMSVR